MSGLKFQNCVKCGVSPGTVNLQGFADHLKYIFNVTCPTCGWDTVVPTIDAPYEEYPSNIAEYLKGNHLELLGGDAEVLVGDCIRLSNGYTPPMTEDHPYVGMSVGQISVHFYRKVGA